MRRIAVLIPAFNEGKTIRAVIKDVRKHVPKARIVVVDDGSSDKTYEIAKEEKVKVIKHKKNRGKGEALKTGFKYLKKFSLKAVVIMDADRQYSAKDSIRVVNAILRGADFVMGKRDFSKVPFRHRLGNWVWRTAFNLFFGTRLRDTNCGFIGLSKTAMKKLRKIHGGYIIENSMLANALKARLRIVQVPVSVNYKNVSPVPRGVRMVLGVLIFIIKEGIKYRLGF